MCENPTCEGHLGKFASCRDEALYEITLDGDESTGSVDFEGYLSLVVIEKLEHVWVTPHDGSLLTVGLEPGAYLIHECSNGFISVDHYETEQEARDIFNVADIAYGEWLNDDDE